MSLQIRLSIIISALFLAGMIVGVSFLVISARDRVSDEIESTATLTYQLLDAMLTEPDPITTRDNTALLDRLTAVDEARHMLISIETPGKTQTDDVLDSSAYSAPRWFVQMVMPPPLEYSRPIGDGGELIVIRTNPADEINEVWRESRNIMTVLLLVLLAINSIFYYTIGRLFKPVSTIVAGLEEVEKGNFSGKISGSSLPELKIIMEKLNHLTSALSKSKAENNRLTQRSLTIQEEERRHMSLELHDELGQSMSAVKAIAFSIANRTGSLDQMSADGAHKIVTITDHVRHHIRSMMGRLRPAILDEFGLIAALEQMIDEWNSHHKNIFCSFKPGPGIELSDSSASINVYRIIQESLTNVASHANADHVEISFTKDENFHLVIKDNGCGFDPDTDNKGSGLSSIRERVNALNGSLSIITEPGSGVTIAISFSFQAQGSATVLTPELLRPNRAR